MAYNLIKSIIDNKQRSNEYINKFVRKGDITDVLQKLESN